ncbi:MAG: CHAT domain-containing protein [Bacteroidota bacterium]
MENRQTETIFTTPAAHYEREMELIKQELPRLQLPPDTSTMIMKAKVLGETGFQPPVVMLPGAVIADYYMLGGNAAHELFCIHFPRIVDYLRPQGPTLLLAYSLLSLAKAFRNYESIDKRISFALEAAAVFKKQGGRYRLARAYLELAVALKDDRQYYDALYTLQLCEQECLMDKDPSGLSAAYFHRATICRFLHQEIEALHFLDRAAAVLPEAGFEGSKREIRYERIPGNILLRRYDEAAADVRALTMAKNDYFMAHFYEAEIARLTNQPETALPAYLKAAELLSLDILQNRSDRFQIISRERHDSIYQHGLQYAVEQGNATAAFQLLLLSRTEGLRALASPRSRNAAARPYDPQLLNELLAHGLQAMQTGQAASMDQIQSDAEWMIAEQDRASYPGGGENMELSGLVNRLQQQIHPHVLLLEFFITGDICWILAVSREAIQLRRAALNTFKIAMLAESFKQERAGLFGTDSLGLLSDSLLSPVGGLLQQKDKLIIVAQEWLNGIPFHAMPGPVGALIESHTVNYVTSFIPFLQPGSQTPDPGTPGKARFLGTPAVGYVRAPALPGVFNESASFKNYFPDAQLIIDPPAASTDLLSPEPVTLLHIACHGYYNPRAPLLSCLLLADRPVFAFELISRGTSARHLVMTACQTAEDRQNAGGYAHSIAAAFLKAGVETLIAAFWPVDDQAGALFSQFFYEAYQRSGTPGTALRYAQRKLRSAPGFAHPHFWAPFAIFGLDNTTKQP